MHALEMTIENKTEESVVLTKQCNKVLKCLHNHRLSNKEIAANLGITASALSNTLQRIRNSKLDLLVVEQIGRNTYYSLSKKGMQYVEENLNNSKLTSIEDKLSNYYSDAVVLIENMKNEYGDDWKIVFDDVLILYASGNINKVESNFKKIFDIIEKLFIEERWDDLNVIYTKLEDEIFKRRIQKFFDRFVGINSLCNIEDEDWMTAYRVVDDFFVNSGDLLHKDLVEKVDNLQINYAQVKLANSSLGKIITEALEQRKTKEELYDRWKKAFVSHERLLYYIAEKYEAKRRSE